MFEARDSDLDDHSILSGLEQREAVATCYSTSTNGGRLYKKSAWQMVVIEVWLLNLPEYVQLMLG